MANTSRKLFVNLAVLDLPRAKRFFEGLGFAFDPQFTNDSAACMILSEHAYVMLLTQPFFQTFTKHKVCDSASHTEAILAISCDNRLDVDNLVKKAVATGGKSALDPQDHGFMYGWSFYDPDGHHWEVIWMDPNSKPSS